MAKIIIDIPQSEIDFIKTHDDCLGWKSTKDIILHAIRNSIPLEERKQGYMIYDIENQKWSYPYECSECNVRLHGEVKYCPNCGSRLLDIKRKGEDNYGDNGRND